MGRFGASEIVIIAVFALLVFGPRRLPEMARSAGKALREFRRATAEVTDELRSIGEIGPDRDAAVPPANRPGPKPESGGEPPKPGTKLTSGGSQLLAPKSGTDGPLLPPRSPRG